MAEEYSPEIRERARALWVSGECTVSGLERRLGVSRARLQGWRRLDDWDGIRNLAEQESRERLSRELAEQVDRVNKEYFDLFVGVMKQVARHFEANPRLEPMELLALTRSLRLAQEGHDAALGRDPKLEARRSVEAFRRQVIVDYDPLVETLEADLRAGLEAAGVRGCEGGVVGGVVIPALAPGASPAGPSEHGGGEHGGGSVGGGGGGGGGGGNGGGHKNGNGVKALLKQLGLGNGNGNGNGNGKPAAPPVASPPLDPPSGPSGPSGPAAPSGSSPGSA